MAGPDWFDHMHLVMLGLCSVPRDDSDFSATEALYEDPLCLPGELLDSDELPPAVFQDKIQSALHCLVLPPPHHWPPSTARVPDALALAEYVFVCEEASLPPLSQLYHGPYKVLSCSSKFFPLQIGSRPETVSIDRLKPVYIDRLKPVHGPDPLPQQPSQPGWPPCSVPAPVPCPPTAQDPVLPAPPIRWNPPCWAHTTASFSLPQR